MLLWHSATIQALRVGLHVRAQDNCIKVVLKP